MAIITNTFTSDDREVMKSLEKMHRELVRLGDENRRLAASARGGASDVGSATSQVVSTMLGMLGASGVEGAIAKITGAYSDWEEQIKKTGETHAKYAAAQAADLAKLRTPAEADRVAAELAALPAASREQGRQLFATVAGAAPTLATDAQLELTRQVGKLAEFGDAFGLNQLGELAAKISELKPGLAAGDAADLALVLRGQVGAPGAGQLTTPEVLRAAAVAQTEGMTSFSRALALSAEALNQNLSPKVIADLVAKSTGEQETFDRRKLGRELTTAEVAQNRFAALSPQERFEALLGDDAALQNQVLGTKMAQQVRQFDVGRVGRRAEEIEAALARDVLGEQLAQFRGTAAGGRAAEMQQRLLGTERGPGVREDVAEAEDMARFEAAFEQSLAGQGWAARALRRTGRTAHSGLYGSLGYSQAEIAGDYARETIRELTQPRLIEGTLNAVAGTNSGQVLEAMQGYLRAQQDAENRAMQERRRQTEILQRIERRGAPALAGSGVE